MTHRLYEMMDAKYSETAYNNNWVTNAQRNGWAANKLVGYIMGYS